MKDIGRRRDKKMFKLSGLQDGYNQKLVVGNTGYGDITFYFHYSDTQVSWWYGVFWEDWGFENHRLLLSPNLLDRFRNIIPFGLQCISFDGGEPLFQSDFTIPRIQLNILTTEERDIVHTYQFRPFIYE